MEGMQIIEGWKCGTLQEMHPHNKALAWEELGSPSPHTHPFSSGTQRIQRGSSGTHVMDTMLSWGPGSALNFIPGG